MTTGELKVLSIIWDWGGEASVNIIARAVGISVDYARLLCESLKRENYIDFLNFKLCRIRGKGKLEVVKRTGKRDSIKLGRNKRGRLALNY